MRVEIDVHYTTQALNIVNSIRIHYLQNLDLSFMCMRVIVYTIVEHSFRNSGRQRLRKFNGALHHIAISLSRVT